MPLIVEPSRLQQTRHQIAQLRALQDQLNATIESLCGLAADQAIETPGAPGSPAASGRLDVTMQPEFLALPLRLGFWRNPATATAISADAKFYSNYRKGLLQIVQQPRPAQSESAYSLVLNYADIDADLLSLVIDARSLLNQAPLPAGRARVNLVLEINGHQHNAMFAKCAWKTGPNKWQDKTVEVRSNQVSIASFEIEQFDPEQVQAMDIHLLCNPASRGSIEIRRLSATLVVQPRPAEAARAANVFEPAP
jgi:hypothetical protein